MRADASGLCGENPSFRVPSGTGPGLPPPRLRYIVCRRHRRVQLVVVYCGYQCPQLGLQLQLAQSAEQQPPCARFSVALPPETPRGCLTGVFSAEFKPGLPGEKAGTRRQRKFGLAPTPLRLCKTPVGVPSGTAEAAQLCESRKAQPGTRLLSPRNAASKRRAADATPRRKAGAAQHTKIGLLSEQLSQAPALSHLVTNRAHRAREPPPPHAARATFTAFIPLNRWRQLVDS